MQENLQPFSFPTASSELERRAWIRHDCELGILYQPGEGRVDYKWMIASVANIGNGGLALVMHHRFDIGTKVAIALVGSDDQISRTLQAQITHVEPFEGSRWLIGCSLLGKLTDDEIRALTS